MNPVSETTTHTNDNNQLTESSALLEMNCAEFKEFILARLSEPPSSFRQQLKDVLRWTFSEVQRIPYQQHLYSQHRKITHLAETTENCITEEDIFLCAIYIPLQNHSIITRIFLASSSQKLAISSPREKW